MKRPTMLYQALLRQAEIDLDLSVERDFRVIESRFEHEGLSFLTITLPILSDHLEKGLEDGFLTCPTNFRRHGSLPAFLRGFFRKVFDNSGKLLADPDAEAIYWIRQICRFYKKPKIGCSPLREKAAVLKFKQVEEELRHARQQIHRQDGVLDAVSNILWGEVFSDFTPLDIVCRHGPGVTADRRLPNERRRIRDWYDRIEAVLPADEYAFGNIRLAYESEGGRPRVRNLKRIGVSDESPVRVVFVPKTLSSPRVIAIEPSSMQFVQQGIARNIMNILESHRLTRNSVRFTEQGPNQRLACLASKDRSLATLDLSDASDRVHNDLVARIFKNSGILDYLQAARSLSANLPDGTNVILEKYASMGSALCFPVEAMVFYTLILSSIHSYLGERVTASSISRISRGISVYGDDLIVPVQYTDVVTEYLESYALRVNRRKSFSRSLFRESCGADYFNGISVKPIYAREIPPEVRSEWKANHVMSWTSTANQFYMTGKWHMAQAIRDMLESTLRRKIPRSRRDGSGVFFSSLIYDTRLTYNASLMSYGQKRLHYIPQKQKDTIDGDSTSCYNLYFERTRPRRDATLSRLEESPPIRGEPSRNEDRIRLRVEYNSGLHLVRLGGDVPRSMGSPANCVSTLFDGETYTGRHLQQVLPIEGGFVKSETDFIHSTKRGVFKSIHRWTAI